MKRGTQEWREAHSRRLSASDIGSALARRGTKRYASLVERLVLDFEIGADHRTEHPDPWAEQHAIDLVAALAIYRKASRADIVEPGLLACESLPWLIATPHALVGDDGCLWLRTHRTMRGLHGRKFTTRDRARSEITMFVCGRSWIDVADTYDGRGEWQDRIEIKRHPFNYDWLSDNVLPRLVTLWGDVRESIDRRKGL